MTIAKQGIVVKGVLGFAAGWEMIPERTCMLKAAGKRDFAAALCHGVRLKKNAGGKCFGACDDCEARTFRMRDGDASAEGDEER